MYRRGIYYGLVRRQAGGDSLAMDDEKEQDKVSCTVLSLLNLALTLEMPPWGAPLSLLPILQRRDCSANHMLLFGAGPALSLGRVLVAPQAQGWAITSLKPSASFRASVLVIM